MLRRFCKPETGIFLGIWLVLLIGGQSRLFRDPGTFWHTVAGQRMLQTGRVLDRDPFSFTFADAPWTPHMWLSECGMAVIHAASGFDGLLLVTVTMLAVLCTWVAQRLIRCGLHWSLAAFVVVLTLGGMALHLHVRPHLFTIIFLGITQAWLCDFEQGRCGLKRLFLLVPLYILWTNLHGGMLGGLGTLGLAGVGWAVLWLFRQPTPFREWRQIVLFAILILLCGLTALVNPYGIELPRTWYTIMQAPLLPQIIAEHSPLRPTSPEGILVLLCGLLYLVALVSAWPQRLRVTWLLPLIWFVLGLTRIRHAPLFCITAGLALADIIPHTRWAQWLLRKGSDLFRPEEAPTARPWDWRPMLIPAGVVLAALVLQVSGACVPVLGAGWARHDPQRWPTELVDDLRAQAGSNPRGTPIFNELDLGGFLIYHAPGYRVFVDDRCELYGDRWLMDFVRAEFFDTAAHIDRWQQQYGRFDHALTQTGSGFDRYFATTPGWLRVRRTAAATFYRRESDATSFSATELGSLLPR